jgi:hypothetical protein
VTPRRSQREKLEDLLELRYLIAQVFPQPADREEWLHSPSRLLRGRTPISSLRQGWVAAVRDALAHALLDVMSQQHPCLSSDQGRLRWKGRTPS